MNAVTAFEHRRQQLIEQLEAAKDMQQAVDFERERQKILEKLGQNGQVN